MLPRHGRSCLVFVIFLGLLSACAPAAAVPPQREEAALYVYRPERPALLQMSKDLNSVAAEYPLILQPACSLSSFFPSPRLDLLAAELACPNGPLAILIDRSSGTVTPLIRDSTRDSHFLAWEREGASVYLRVDSLADPRILRVDVSSLRTQQLPIDAYTYDMDSTPDGSHISFSLSHGMGLGSELWLADANGRGAKLILADPENILAFARWSPDGRQIAYIRIPDSQVPYTVGELWVAEADGSGARKLAEADAGHGFAAAWSPDGKRLAFVVRSNPGDSRADQSLDALVSNMAVVDIQTGELTAVTQFVSGRTGTPAWSPDGNTLSFPYVLNGRMEVQIADLTSGTQTILDLPLVCCPVWMRK